MSIATMTDEPVDMWAGAACRQSWVRPEIFDIDGREDHGETAKTVCRACPIKLQCLDWALQHEDHLVWGGMTPDERGALRQLGTKAA